MRRLPGASFLICLLAWSGHIAAVAAATIAYPDMRVEVPVSEITIGFPSPSTRELRFSHVSWNAGAGPWEFRPAYNASTGLSTVQQALYVLSGPTQWTFDHSVSVAVPMRYVPPDDYDFPLAQFELHAVNSDGSIGPLVTRAPKLGFCMTADQFVGGVPNTPSSSAYPPINCENPNAPLGLSVGWGDKYDYMDEGGGIDITSVPDGTYWLRVIADPYHYIAESDTSNNITDTKLTLSGSTVTVLLQTHPNSTPPTVALTTPASGADVSGSVPLAAAASGPRAIMSVQFLLDGQPLGPPLIAAPYSMTWNVGSTAPGQHILSAQAVDTNGFYGTAPAVVVSVEQTIGTFGLEGMVTNGTGTVTTPPFSTSGPNRLLLAFVGSDGPAGAGRQSSTVSGAGLSWNLVKRSNGQSGDAEIWSAMAPTALSGVSVTSTPSASGFDQSLTVVSIAGAGGVGATASAGAASGAPSVAYTSTAAGSLGIAVGNDYSNAIARTLGSGQLWLSQWLDTRTGDAYWVQARSATTTTAGQTVTLNDTAPTGDTWNLAAVEVLPASAPPTDTTPPAGNFLNPANGQTVSGTVPVNVNATDNVAVASVQLTLDGHALGPLLTAPPYAWSWDTTTASAGNHTLGAVIRDSSGNTGAATAIVVDVENPAPPMACFIIDAKSFVDGSNTVTTPPFTTALPGELLLAFVSADGSLRTTQTATVSGAGLTWTLVARANGQAGTAEIWTATAATPLSNVTVTSRLQKNGYHQSLSVIAMQGTDGLGASAFASRSSGAPQVSLTTTRANSLVFGVGIDWDQAIPRTLDVNQTLLHQWVDTATGTTFWVQNTSVQSGPAGSLVMLDDTAPTGDRWDFAAVEVIGAAE